MIKVRKRHRKAAITIQRAFRNHLIKKANKAKEMNMLDNVIKV